MTQIQCRLCGQDTGPALIGFDALPVAGCYVRQDAEADPCRPLSVHKCPRCGLVQLGQGLEEGFYDDYRFVGDVSSGYKAHIEGVASWLGAIMPARAVVIEIGASNGALLKACASRGLQVAGFEPAHGPSSLARAQGLDVVTALLTPDTAIPFMGEADAIVIRHVLEHIEDLSTFMAGATVLAHPGTRLVIEVPDLPSTIEAGLHSNFYHPHISYFDRDSMAALLARHGWRVDRTSIVDIFGGSLLLTASRIEAPPWDVRSQPGEPCSELPLEAFERFIAQWAQRAASLRGFLEAQRAEGLVVDGYGAAERTVAAMGVAGLTRDHVRRLYDRNPLLEGWCVPGGRMPICAPEALMAPDSPDLLVIFALSHEREIMAERVAFLEGGGRFVSLRGDTPRIIDLDTWRRENARAQMKAA